MEPASQYVMDCIERAANALLDHIADPDVPTHGIIELQFGASPVLYPLVIVGWFNHRLQARTGRFYVCYAAATLFGAPENPDFTDVTYDGNLCLAICTSSDSSQTITGPKMVTDLADCEYLLLLKP
jgi:hypothetical protein